MPDPITDPFPDPGPAPRPEAIPDFLNADRPPVPNLVVPTAVQPFHLAGRPVRGRLIRLGPLADALLSRHGYAPPVARLVGQAMALTAGLAAALKYRGSFSLQAKGDSVVPMLLADCTDDGQLRGQARVDHPALATLMEVDHDPPAAGLLGRGYLAFTCDQGPDMERYQGIVAMDGIHLADMTQSYFRTSEQLQAHVRLACARTEAGWRASALILERVAGDGGLGETSAEEQDDAWSTALALVGTLKDAEMLDDALSAPRLLHLLFHAEGLELDLPRALSYGCRCSRARLSGVLAGFSDADLTEMTQDGAITMTCEFCNYDFRFAPAEVRR
ncbi:MAG: Hsp33 family molecular chaperone HslO [Rubritepida sp.]|nr:Hsp33 family molecular chaperone HslO [Rubritepida sp.]